MRYTVLKPVTSTSSQGERPVRQQQQQLRVAAVATLTTQFNAHLPGPGPAQSRLLQRSALHRLGDRARLVQRHRAPQRRHRLLHDGRLTGSTGYSDLCSKLADRADRPWLLGRPGYDLVSGLGTPNGTLLARALTAIAHSQGSFSPSPALLTTTGRAAGRAAPTRRCCSRPGDRGGAGVHVDLGSHATDCFSATRAASPGRPAGAAVTAGRLRSRPGPDVRPTVAGRPDVGERRPGEDVTVHNRRRGRRASQATLSSPSASPTSSATAMPCASPAR